MPPGSAAPLGRRAEEKPGPPSSPLPAIPPRSTIPRSQAPPGRGAALGSPQSRRRRPRAPLRGLGAPRVWRLRPDTRGLTNPLACGSDGKEEECCQRGDRRGMAMPATYG